MRVSAAIIMVALVIAAPLDVYADFRIQGELVTNLSAAQSSAARTWSVMSSSRLSGRIEIFPQEQDNIVAVVNFGGRGAQASPDRGIPFREIFPTQIDAESSYLEVTTPLWYGGPQWLYRFGNQSPRWHSFISRPPETDGIVVSNINLGAWNNQLLYLWGTTPNLVTLGVQTTGLIGGARVAAAYVTRNSASEIAADAHFNLLNNRLQFRVGGAYSASRLHRLEAVSAITPTTGLRVEHRYAYTEGFRAFSPVPSAPAPSVSHSLKVSTRMLGLNWDVSASTRDGAMSGLTVRADQSLYVGKTPVTLTYSIGGLHGDEHVYDVGVRTTVNLFDIHRVSLRGSVGYTPLGIRWSVGSAYGVPHGFNFELSHTAQGTSFSAGVRLRY